MFAEVFSAFEVSCRYCGQAVVVRISLDMKSGYFCSLCRLPLSGNYLLLQRIRKLVTPMFSFDCDNCGRENITCHFPEKCVYCGSVLEYC